MSFSICLRVCRESLTHFSLRILFEFFGVFFKEKWRPDVTKGGDLNAMVYVRVRKTKPAGKIWEKNSKDESERGPPACEWRKHAHVSSLSVRYYNMPWWWWHYKITKGNGHKEADCWRCSNWKLRGETNKRETLHSIRMIHDPLEFWIKRQVYTLKSRRTAFDQRQKRFNWIRVFFFLFLAGDDGNWIDKRGRRTRAFSDTHFIL